LTTKEDWHHGEVRPKLPQSPRLSAESAVRAYRIAMTPPMALVVLVVDSEMQEAPFTRSGLRIPRLTMTSPPAGDPAAVQVAARLLVQAQNPMILAQRATRTPNGIKLLVELRSLPESPPAKNIPLLNQP